jgi:hypothetical protein
MKRQKEEPLQLSRHLIKGEDPSAYKDEEDPHVGDGTHIGVQNLPVPAIYV